MLLTTALVDGGAEVFLKNLEKMLATQGHRVYVVVNHPIDKEKHPQNYYSLHQSNSFLNKFWKPFRLKKFLKNNAIDLIIDNRAKLSFFKTIFYEYAFGKHQKIKMVHSFQTDGYLFKSKLINQFLFKNYAKIIGVSQAIQKKIERQTALKNVSFIHNAVPNIQLSQSTKSPISTDYILYYGRFDNRSKNLDLLIDAYRQSILPQKNIALVLMGKGRDQEHLQNKIADENNSKKIHLIPYQSLPYDVVSQAKFTVLSSHYEGFPMTIVESLSLGVPVLTTDFEGVHEVMIHQYNGLITDKKIEHYTVSLNQLVADDNLYQNCQKNAAKSVAHLSSKVIEKQWQTLIETITEKH